MLLNFPKALSLSLVLSVSVSVVVSVSVSLSLSLFQFATSSGQVCLELISSKLGPLRCLVLVLPALRRLPGRGE